MTGELILKEIQERKKICWDMAKVFLANEDSHGLHDMGVEIQALERVELEFERLNKAYRKKTTHF